MINITEIKSAESIYRDLKSLREEVAQIRGSGILSFAKHSDWSAHADWSNSSKNLPGKFSLSSHIGIPDSTAQLDKIIAESTSTRFLEVAKSLKATLVETTK